MLFLLRKIRRKLLMKNKVTTYLLYALGEIVLVVVGILIAVQIDDWNESRKLRQEEKSLLKSINLEFKKNNSIISNTIAEHENSKNAGVALMRLIGADRQTIENNNVDSLFYNFFTNADFILSNSAINNITQSGKMNLIGNDTVVNRLNEWKAAVDYALGREQNLDNWIRESYITLVAEYISFKEMDANRGYVWTGQTKLETDYSALFQNLKFENYLENTLYIKQSLIDAMVRVDSLSTQIIEITDSQ